MTTPIALACAAAALMLWVEHYALLPYARHIWRKELPTLVRYVLGTLALNGSLVILFWLSPDSGHGLAVVSVTASGGIAVLVAYGLDWTIESIAQWRESRELQRGQ